MSEPSLDMLVAELKSVSKMGVKKNESGNEIDHDATSYEKVKRLIEAINAMPLDPGVLLEAMLRYESIFPVKKGKLRILKCAAETFFITDRPKYQEAFKNDAWILDYSLEQARELAPFLKSFKFEDRYLSRRVKERSTFGGSMDTFSDGLTKDLHLRAKALCRYVPECFLKFPCL